MTYDIHDSDNQAYPAAWGNHEQGGDYVPGMTLRDYFAGQVLPAIVSVTSAGTHQPGLSNPDIAGRPIEDRIAYDTYRLADAMLKERSK